MATPRHSIRASIEASHVRADGGDGGNDQNRLWVNQGGLQLGSVIAFAIITETVFQWPGMGLMFLQAVQNVDIPIMAAYLLMIAFLFVIINLAVDILYVVVDPRIRITGRAA